MSLLKSKNGIRCDTCGSKHVNVFAYYACEGTGFKYDSTSKPAVHKENGMHLSFDMCPICYDNYKKLILNNIKDAQEGYIKDDFSSKFYDSTDYIRIDLTRVNVDKNKENGKQLDTEVDIDIIIAGDSLKDLLQVMLEVRNKAEQEEAEGKDEWTTSA